MGFGEQLREILGRLPDARQTLLFSATLPKLLVEFAKAGLSDPTLIRLDVDTKIPETLKMAFFHCREEGKTAALLHLLKTVIPTEQQTVVFCATRHHVEYLHLLLDEAGISNTFIYSVLDPTARKINAAKFQAKKCRVLIVTDLAARGIDIPLLDNVINFNFPCKSKLFVHRVGRVARAGRAGTSYSLVAGDEVAYFIDLQLFLGNSIKLSPVHCPADADWHNVLGALGQQIYDDYADLLHSWHERAQDLSNMKQVAANGYKQYLKSRTGASVESVKRARKMKAETIGTHPLLVRETTEVEQERTNFLEQMKNFRPANVRNLYANLPETIVIKFYPLFRPSLRPAILLTALRSGRSCAARGQYTRPPSVDTTSGRRMKMWPLTMRKRMIAASMKQMSPQPRRRNLRILHR